MKTLRVAIIVGILAALLALPASGFVMDLVNRGEYDAGIDDGIECIYRVYPCILQSLEHFRNGDRVSADGPPMLLLGRELGTFGWHIFRATLFAGFSRHRYYSVGSTRFARHSIDEFLSA